jgi:ribosome modulation factor
LVEIEYQQKQEQTKQVVAAQTKVEVAKQDMEQQRIQAQAQLECPFQSRHRASQYLDG